MKQNLVVPLFHRGCDAHHLLLAPVMIRYCWPPVRCYTGEVCTIGLCLESWVSGDLLTQEGSVIGRLQYRIQNDKITIAYHCYVIGT